MSREIAEDSWCMWFWGWLGFFLNSETDDEGEMGLWVFRFMGFGLVVMGQACIMESNKHTSIEPIINTEYFFRVITKTNLSRRVRLL